MENFEWVNYYQDKTPEEIHRGIDIQGWVDHRVPPILHQYCQGKKVLVNIGTWKGASTVIMAEAAGPGSVVFGVDHFRGSPEERHSNHIEAANHPLQVLAKFHAYVTKLNLWGRIILISQDSVGASYYFEPGSVDLIYVDGDHSEEGVTQDLINWLPKLKKGGIMLGDDLDWGGVRAALDTMNLVYTEPSPDKVWMIKNE